MGLTQKCSYDDLDKYGLVWVGMGLTRKCSKDYLDKYGCFSEVWVRLRIAQIVIWTSLGKYGFASELF